MSAKSGKWLRFRVASILIFFLVLYVALVSRAFQLQVVSGETLGKLADRQHKKSLTLYPERRFIFDRNGQKLAATIMADSVYVDPSSVEEHRKVSSKLSSILGVKRQKIVKALSNQGSFRWIARQISPVRAERIRALVEVELQRRLERGGWLDDLSAGEVSHFEAPAMQVDRSDGDDPLAHGLAKSIAHAVRVVKGE